ncbi:MAG: N,N-diacetylchitobiose transport system permease protein [Gaiellaceae bacterium]|jgi:N,N'-diacetylchitobiose transport system permease protein|nr:N,N-diacetylchitobiose transport system permease protein [Gaiellaceae bacterium]
MLPTPVVADSGSVLRRRRRSRRRFAGRAGWNALGLLVFVVMVFPVYWMIATAFKPGHDILSYTPKFFPAPLTLSNFSDAMHHTVFWTDVKNSLIIVGVVVALSLVIGFLAALALAKFHFYGRKGFIVIIIGVLMVPLNALIIPLYIELSKVHQVNTLTGVIVTYLTFVLPFTIWTLRGFMLGVPRELEEAAMVDGATRFGAFVRILLPLVAPGLVATSLFAFIQAWNEYIIAYVFLHDESKQTLTVWLASFTTLRGTDWGPLMAGATLTALPVVVFFVLVQRKIAFGLTAGAVKA